MYKLRIYTRINNVPTNLFFTNSNSSDWPDVIAIMFVKRGSGIAFVFALGLLCLFFFFCPTPSFDSVFTNIAFESEVSSSSKNPLGI